MKSISEIVLPILSYSLYANRTGQKGLSKSINEFIQAFKKDRGCTDFEVYIKTETSIVYRLTSTDVSVSFNNWKTSKTTSIDKAASSTLRDVLGGLATSEVIPIYSESIEWGHSYLNEYISK